MPITRNNKKPLLYQKLNIIYLTTRFNGRNSQLWPRPSPTQNSPYNEVTVNIRVIWSIYFKNILGTFN